MQIAMSFLDMISGMINTVRLERIHHYTMGTYLAWYGKVKEMIKKESMTSPTMPQTGSLLLTLINGHQEAERLLHLINQQALITALRILVMMPTEISRAYGRKDGKELQ